MDKVAKSEDPYIVDEVYHSCKGVISNQVFGGNESVYRQPVFHEMIWLEEFLDPGWPRCPGPEGLS